MLSTQFFHNNKKYANYGKKLKQNPIIAFYFEFINYLFLFEVLVKCFRTKKYIKVMLILSLLFS